MLFITNQLQRAPPADQLNYTTVVYQLYILFLFYF